MIKPIAAPDTGTKETGLAGMNMPPVIFGTGALGNLFVALEDVAKYAIVRACLHQLVRVPVFDSAGKYGAGLALEPPGKYCGLCR